MNNYEYDTKYVAGLLNLSERRIRQLAQDNIITKNENDLYDIRVVMREYINFKFNTSNTESFEKEKAKHEEIKRQLSELKLKKAKNELMEVKDIEYAVSMIINNARSILLSMSSRLAPLLINENEINNIKSKMDKEVYRALNELSNYKFEDIPNDYDKELS